MGHGCISLWMSDGAIQCTSADAVSGRPHPSDPTSAMQYADTVTRWHVGMLCQSGCATMHVILVLSVILFLAIPRKTDIGNATWTLDILQRLEPRAACADAGNWEMPSAVGFRIRIGTAEPTTRRFVTTILLIIGKHRAHVWICISIRIGIVKIVSCRTS